MDFLLSIFFIEVLILPHFTSGFQNDTHITSLVERTKRDLYKHHKPFSPKKCHPEYITKYKTVYKERKANVVNQVELINPEPVIKKIYETRYTTIRYPVFITQVIKPVLTQVETKVKPIFFTKTIKKFTTVLFTVTGIGQVTVTKLKYEKEYITRCLKKGYHRSDNDHVIGGSDKMFNHKPNNHIVGNHKLDSHVVLLNHRNNDKIVLNYDKNNFKKDIPPPPGLPYELVGHKLPRIKSTHVLNKYDKSDNFAVTSRESDLKSALSDVLSATASRPTFNDKGIKTPNLSNNLPPLRRESNENRFKRPLGVYKRPPLNRKRNRMRPKTRPSRNNSLNPQLEVLPRNPIQSSPNGVRRLGDANDFEGLIGNVQDLYSMNYYDNGRQNPSRNSRQLFTSTHAESLAQNFDPFYAHPSLNEIPVVILT